MHERTDLVIHTIVTRRREAFYWLTVLVTFALGTAMGDLMAEPLHLGYAYILTRPLGASIGDLLSQPRDAGGLGLGTTVTSAVFLAVIVVLVTYLTVTGRDVIAPGPGDAPTSAHRGALPGAGAAGPDSKGPAGQRAKT